MEDVERNETERTNYFFYSAGAGWLANLASYLSSSYYTVVSTTSDCYAIYAAAAAPAASALSKAQDMAS